VNSVVNAGSIPASIPHRKIIRSWLVPISTRNTALAIALVIFDIALFLSLVAATILVANVVAKLCIGFVAGLVIGRLFILGHDACHQSFTTHRELNQWIGRIVFLPSLTPYSLWDVGHNVVHHGYTNLRGFDFVWEPHTLESFQKLPRWRQLLERTYRSGFGPGLYYLIEVWWKKLLFPNKKHMPTRRKIFTQDGLLATGFALLWIAALAVAAAATQQSVWLTVFCGFLLPFLVWNSLIGWVVYVHHTHEGIAWHEEKAAWSAAQPFVSTTVHLTFKNHLGINAGTLLHHIMEHTAHHVDMSIPLYRLKAAQAVLEEKLPGAIVRQPFSWGWYFDTASRCKLYDYRMHCWTDFSGRLTTAPVITSTASI